MWSGKTDSSSFLSLREPEKPPLFRLSLDFKEILFFSQKKLAISAHIDYNNTVNRICTFSSVGRAPDS
jgi:hypothetical protein